MGRARIKLTVRAPVANADPRNSLKGNCNRASVPRHRRPIRTMATKDQDRPWFERRCSGPGPCKSMGQSPIFRLSRDPPPAPAYHGPHPAEAATRKPARFAPRSRQRRPGVNGESLATQQQNHAQQPEQEHCQLAVFCVCMRQRRNVGLGTHNEPGPPERVPGSCGPRNFVTVRTTPPGTQPGEEVLGKQ